MLNAEYQRLPYISSHTLKDLLESPAHCYRRHIDPQRSTVDKQTAAMRFGSLVHCLALTPLYFGDEFILSDRKDRRSAAADERIAVSVSEFERAHSIAAALKANADANNLLKGGKKEHTIIQQRASDLLPLKARLDIYHESRGAVGELKTISDLSRIQQNMERYHYPLSAAFYADISNSTSVHFVFVQTSEPYEVEVFELSPSQIQKGREQYQQALNTFDECWKSGHWAEAAPAMADDDDPLMMDLGGMATTAPRHDLPVGELQL